MISCVAAYSWPDLDWQRFFRNGFLTHVFTFNSAREAACSPARGYSWHCRARQHVKRADLERDVKPFARRATKTFYFRLYRRSGSLLRRICRHAVRANSKPCSRAGRESYRLPLEATVRTSAAGLDLNKIKSHPKIFVAYSDLTSLLTLLFRYHRFGHLSWTDDRGKTGLMPWACNLASWQAALTGASSWELDPDALSGASGLVDGTATEIFTAAVFQSSSLLWDSV